MQLPKYWFDICVALETFVQGKHVENADDLEESVKVGLEDLER